jgi:dihydrofolate reductase
MTPLTYWAGLRKTWRLDQGIGAVIPMRKLILRMSMSLDGFVGGPKGNLDWIFRNTDEESIAFGVAQLWEAGVHAMGGVTYRDMAAHWPTSTEPWAPPMNEIPKVVFSKTLKEASWGPTQILTGDLAEEVACLKTEPGKDILAHGGAGFARSLTRLGLVDEYWLLVHPVALGAGLSVFEDLPKPLALKLVSVKAFAGGTVAKTYRPA